LSSVDPADVGTMATLAEFNLPTYSLIANSAIIPKRN
jgi:hypothetical protein